jgi:hypothetical protein
VSKFAYRLALTLALTPPVGETALAQAASARPSDMPSVTLAAATTTLPTVVVGAPPRRQHRGARGTPARPRRSAIVAAPVNSSASFAAPGSGAPDVAAGPVGPPNMASQMRVTGEELNARPFTRPGEILEATPGLIVTQHSGEGKANQYFLRGYNLDHGTDLAISVDDVPVNMRTHAHGQGYADLNWLMPETVNALEIRKGPYFADEGDFSSVGNLQIGLIDSANKTMASMTFGSFGYRRVFSRPESAMVRCCLPARPACITGHGSIPTTCARSTA